MAVNVYKRNTGKNMTDNCWSEQILH